MGCIMSIIHALNISRELNSGKDSVQVQNKEMHSDVESKLRRFRARRRSSDLEAGQVTSAEGCLLQSLQPLQHSVQLSHSLLCCLAYFQLPDTEEKHKGGVMSTHSHTHTAEKPAHNLVKLSVIKKTPSRSRRYDTDLKIKVSLADWLIYLVTGCYRPFDTVRPHIMPAGNRKHILSDLVYFLFYFPFWVFCLFV